MKKVLGVMVVLLLAVSFLAACGEEAPAEFTLSSVTVSPSPATVNDTVTISATVTNVGEQSGDCDVSLTIDGYTDSESVTLAGGASTPVSFSYAATTEGSYTAALSTPDDSATKSFTVRIEGEEEEEVEGVPVWSAGDNWVYSCSYANPGGKVEQDTNELNITMVAEVTVEGEACYKLSGVMVPPWTREPATLPMVLHIGTAEIWNSKEYMECLKYSSAIAELPGLPSNVTWTYVGDYGWPYEVGKTWSAAVHTVAGPLDETTEVEFKVLGVETITVPVGTFECYHIVTYDPASPDTYTFEHWFNATVVKSDVKMIERDLWKGEEIRELTSYSVS